jgi:MFS family permease
MLSPLYMAEISPPELRGSLMALEQFSIVLGVVVGFWTGFITRSSGSALFLLSYALTSAVPSSASWRIPLSVQLLPGVILGLGCIFLPPSPRLLVLHERYDDALQSLAKLRQRPSSDELLQVILPLHIP